MKHSHGKPIASAGVEPQIEMPGEAFIPSEPMFRRKTLNDCTKLIGDIVSIVVMSGVMDLKRSKEIATFSTIVEHG